MRLRGAKSSLSMLFQMLFSLFLIAPEAGDLVFLDLDCGPLCDSIEQVTQQQFGEGPNLSHVGVVIKNASGIHVLEAWPVGGVTLSEWKSFTLRVSNQDRIWIARPPQELKDLSLNAIQEMRSHLGKPYDSQFLLSTESFYCSELIYEGWKYFVENPFKLLPMYYGATNSKDFRIWSNYFAQWNMEVPSGLAGISPLGVYLMAKRAGFETGPLSHFSDQIN